MIGVISALNEELLEVIKNLDTKKIKIKNFEFYTTKILDKDVVFGICGVGKVNAGIYTQAMIDNFDTEYIINIGVAGSTDDRVSIGSLVIVTECFYYDFDCTEAGSYTLGQIPGLKDVNFKCDERLIELSTLKAKKVLSEEKIFKGIIATGDKFVAKKEIKDSIKKEFDSLCCEMESCAIAHTCHVNDVKYLILRSISDNADESADVDFNEFLLKSAKIVKEIIIDVIKEI